MNPSVQKKRILIINQHFSTGGIKKSLETLLPVLMKDYDVKVLLLCGSTDEFDKRFPGIRINSPFVISSALSSLKDNKTMNCSFLRVSIKILFCLFSRFIKTERLVHFCISISRNLGSYDAVISYAHDNWSDNGDFFGGGNYLAIKKTSSANKISWVHGEPATIGLNKERLFSTYSAFNNVVAVSDAVKKQFEDLSEGRIVCTRIYNLMDIATIKEKSESTVYEEKDPLCFRIVTVGRLSKVAKRIDKVNEIAKKLKNSGYQFKWTVVGGGSEFESCVRIANEYKLENFVEYVGDQDNPYKFMKRSDLFVLVSDTEAMPLVLNEALIVGTPVVTTDFAAAKESVIDGITGFITEKDVDSLYRIIAYCIDNPETLKEMRFNITQHPYSNNAAVQTIRQMEG